MEQPFLKHLVLARSVRVAGYEGADLLAFVCTVEGFGDCWFHVGDGKVLLRLQVYEHRRVKPWCRTAVGDDEDRSARWERLRSGP